MAAPHTYITTEKELLQDVATLINMMLPCSKQLNFIYSRRNLKHYHTAGELEAA